MGDSEQPKYVLCGEPMPLGEEMFKYHGYSGPCPKPPLPKKADTAAERLLDVILEEQIEGVDSNSRQELLAKIRAYKAGTF